MNTHEILNSALDVRILQAIICALLDKREGEVELDAKDVRDLANDFTLRVEANHEQRTLRLTVEQLPLNDVAS
jgi:hypothetical protein